MIDQIGVCSTACVAAIPSKATSVAVSNPRPNNSPIGYMCQLRPTSLKTDRRTTRAPLGAPRSPATRLLRAAALPCRVESLEDIQKDEKIHDRDQQQEKRRDRRADNSADLLKLRKMVPHIARALRHHQRHQHDHGGMAQRKEESDADRLLILLHQFPRHIVDRGDVIGVDGVTQAESVGKKAQAQRRRAGMKQRDGQKPSGDVQADEKDVDEQDPAPQRAAFRLCDNWSRFLEASWGSLGRGGRIIRFPIVYYSSRPCQGRRSARKLLDGKRRAASGGKHRGNQHSRNDRPRVHAIPHRRLSNPPILPSPADPYNSSVLVRGEANEPRDCGLSLSF